MLLSCLWCSLIHHHLPSSLDIARCLHLLGSPRTRVMDTNLHPNILCPIYYIWNLIHVFYLKLQVLKSEVMWNIVTDIKFSHFIFYIWNGMYEWYGQIPCIPFLNFGSDIPDVIFESEVPLLYPKWWLDHINCVENWGYLTLPSLTHLAPLKSLRTFYIYICKITFFSFHSICMYMSCHDATNSWLIDC